MANDTSVNVTGVGPTVLPFLPVGAAASAGVGTEAKMRFDASTISAASLRIAASSGMFLRLSGHSRGVGICEGTSSVDDGEEEEEEEEEEGGKMPLPVENIWNNDP